MTLTLERTMSERTLIETVEIEPRDERELVIARLIDAPAEALYRGWTDSELLPLWFCPKPWTTEVVRNEVQVGGVQELIMHGPNGEAQPSTGIWLQLIPGRRVVFTGALTEDFRPNPGEFQFVGDVTFEPQADGRTLYIARAMHWDVATRDQHAEMGFHEGWGQCAVQLAELAQTL